MNPTVFPMIPAAANSWAGWIFVPIVILAASTILLLGRTLYGARHATFELSEQGLVFHGDIWGRRIALADLRGGAARIVDISQEPGLKPARRTMGTALPSYQSGWFRLADGEKALLYLTARDHALYIPTTKGYAVLLSPKDPAGMLAEIQRLAPGR
ncbi:MAG: PH domain-containing protein [Gemmatimonadales bacterium]